MFCFVFVFQLKFHENWGTFYLYGNTLSSKDAHSYGKMYFYFIINTILFYFYTTDITYAHKCTDTACGSG